MTLLLSGCFNVTSCHAFFQKRFKHIMSIWQSQSSSLRNNRVSEPRRGSLHLLLSLNTTKTVLFFRQLKKAASFERKSFSRAVLWIASHCWTDSRREEYVKQLSKFIPVTVVGKCANVGLLFLRTKNKAKNLNDSIDTFSCIVFFLTKWRSVFGHRRL